MAKKHQNHRQGRNLKNSSWPPDGHALRGGSRIPPSSSDGASLTTTIKGKTPAQIASESQTGNQATLPDGVPPGLARILRPQAASRWLLPSLAVITPQYVEMILRGALAGNQHQQWEMFDLMLDTWPELAGCLQELTEGVMCRKLVFEPFAEVGESATPIALDKHKLVSAALRRMRPDVCADENDLEDTIKDIIDGWVRGMVCLETDWHSVAAGTLGDILAPRATFWAHPSNFGWAENGKLGLRVGNGIQMLPPHKFIVGVHKAKSGSAMGGALLRPLAWWWCAANFASDWLLNLAQIFGLPFRWANYDPNAPQGTIDAICNMLQNMGSAGWAAFPAGTTMELKDSGKSGDASPQGDLLDRADRYARMLVLGQTMSGSQDSSKGGGKAFGSVEANVKSARTDACAIYAAKVMNTQLIPSIVELNYGDRDECPTLRIISDDDAGMDEAARDKTLAELMPIPLSYLRRKYEIPEPTAGEETTASPAKTSTTPGLVDQLAALSGITDDAIFSKQLNDLIGTL
jgi:phage gp29-like protein